MAEFPTYEQMAKNVAEKALDEILYDGKSIREWMKIIAEQEPICDRDCEHCNWTECPIEPCDDAISRKVVIQTLNKMDRYTATELTLCDTDKKFPANEVFIVDDVYEQIAEQLPPVTQKSGKWIKIQSGDKDFPESIVCSMCGNENSHLDFNENAESIGKVFVTSKYCPNCGAKMESEEV